MSTFFNFTLSSSSPVVSYSQEPGWSQFSSQASSESQADSYHVAQQDQASFQLTFQGSAIELLGSANCTFDIILDEQQFTSRRSQGNQLFRASNLSPTDRHTLTLQAHPYESARTSLSFEKAVIFTPATDVAIQTIPTPPLQYSPQWSTNSTTHFTSTAGEFAEWNFTGINAVEIRGSLGSDHGLYEVSLDNIVTTHNASSSSFIPVTTKFYASGLNENGTHTLRITNVQNDSVLAVSEVVAYTIYNFAAPNDPVQPTPVSAAKLDEHQLTIIVAPVIAVVFFLFLGAFYFVLRRRRLRHRAKMYDANYVVPFPHLRTSMSVGSSYGKKSRFGSWASNPFKWKKAPTTAAECAKPGAPKKIGLPQNPKALLPPKAS